MKLATWNVNSLKARMPRVLEFLGQHAPDVLLLQETKVEDAAFPDAELRDAGYHAVHHSRGRWAGVAILSREELTDPSVGLPGEAVEDEARWIEATTYGLRLASVYVPNGRAVDSPTFAEKLQFLEAMRDRVGAIEIVGGDFNVTRDDRDVYDPEAFVGSTHVTPEERSRFEALLGQGFVDAYRHLSEEVGYTWWDYRAGHFHKKMGLRIDYVLVAERHAGAVISCGIDRNYRKGKPTPSDHAPLLCELNL
jgi:exodeoxyribonuclease III